MILEALIHAREGIAAVIDTVNHFESSADVRTVNYIERGSRPVGRQGVELPSIHQARGTVRGFGQ